MADWSTYSLSDFLLFSPRVYDRLFELANAAAWPGHIVALGVGALLIWTAWSGRPTGKRAALVLLSAVWAFVGWFFVLGHYATINWAATWIAVAFFVQSGACLLAAALARIETRRSGAFAQDDANARSRSVAALPLTMLTLAVFGYPLLAPACQQPWLQAEVFAIAPDPTAVAALAWLAATRSRGWRWVLMIIPGLWCVVTGLTLWVMEDGLFWIPPVAAALAVAAAIAQTPPRSERSTRSGAP